MAQGHYKAISEQGVEKLWAYQQFDPEGLPFKYEQRWQAISAANKEAPPRLKVRRTGKVYGRPAIFEPDDHGYACHIEGDTTVVHAGTKKQGLQLLRQAVMNGQIDLQAIERRTLVETSSPDFERAIAGLDNEAFTELYNLIMADGNVRSTRAWPYVSAYLEHGISSIAREVLDRVMTSRFASSS